MNSEDKPINGEPQGTSAAEATGADSQPADSRDVEQVTPPAKRSRTRRAAALAADESAASAAAPTASAADTGAAKSRRARAKAEPQREAAREAEAAAATAETEAVAAAVEEGISAQETGEGAPAGAGGAPTMAEAAPAAAKPRRRRTRAEAAARAGDASPGAGSAKQPRVAKVRAAHDTRHGEAGKATVVDAQGKVIDAVALNAGRFNVVPKVDVLHLAVRAEQAARRRGTASSKTRGEVSGSTAKLYRQKGTGRARAGSVKSPTRSGGGIAFGPHPRHYEMKVNKKVARQALAMALSDRALGGDIYVARGLDLDRPSTARLNEFLVNLDIAVPVLVITDDEEVVAKSARNLRYAECAEARTLSTEQVLRARSVVMTEKALAVLNEA